MEIKMKPSTLHEEFLFFPAPDFAICNEKSNYDKKLNFNDNNTRNKDKNQKLIVPGALFSFFSTENDER